MTGARFRDSDRALTLHYEVRGAPAGPTILWLHGALVSGWMWQPQLEALPEFRSIVVNLPGHGPSHDVEWKSFSDTADKLVAVLDAADVSEPVHLVGMSLGALTALHMMATAHERIRRAVLTGAVAKPLSRAMTWTSLAVGALTQLPGAEGLVGRALQLPPEARAGFSEAGLALDRRSWFRINDELHGDCLPEGLERIDRPTLLLAGEKEQKITLDSQGILRQRLPVAEARLAPDCHHAWSGEKPALFSATVAAWVREQALPGELLDPAE